MVPEALRGQTIMPCVENQKMAGPQPEGVVEIGIDLEKVIAQSGQTLFDSNQAFHKLPHFPAQPLTQEPSIEKQSYANRDQAQGSQDENLDRAGRRRRIDLVPQYHRNEGS